MKNILKLGLSVLVVAFLASCGGGENSGGGGGSSTDSGISGGGSGSGGSGGTGGSGSGGGTGGDGGDGSGGTGGSGGGTGGGDSGGGSGGSGGDGGDGSGGTGSGGGTGGDGGGDSGDGTGGGSGSPSSVGAKAADYMSIYPEFDDGGAAVDWSNIDVEFYPVPEATALAYSATLGNTSGWMKVDYGEGWYMYDFADYFDIHTSIVFWVDIEFSIYTRNRGMTYADLDIVYPAFIFDANVVYVRTQTSYKVAVPYAKIFNYKKLLIINNVFAESDCVSDNATYVDCYLDNGTEIRQWQGGSSGGSSSTYVVRKFR